jgi:ferredoxin
MSAHETTTVNFSLSAKSLTWNDSCESLLDFAEENNIEISAGCRYGDCGTCLTRLVEGRVIYNHQTGIDPDQGYCLPCSCRPDGSITLDA